MFEVVEASSGRTVTVYGVHKSGPMDQQTKFLVFEGGWQWVWSNRFRPGGPPEVNLIPGQIDMIAPPVTSPEFTNTA